MSATNYNILHQKQLKKPLSGNQIENLLNYFLLRALNPICQTLWFKNAIANCLDQNMRSPKMKIYNKNKDVCISNIYNIIFLFEKEEILNALRNACLDRGLLQDIIIDFLNAADLLAKANEDFYKSLNNGIYSAVLSDKINNLENYFQGLNSSYLLNLRSEVRYWFENYIEFKNLIAGKYYRLACKFAKNAKASRPNAVDGDCLFKSLLVAIDTALNKYTCEKGTLASYVQVWFKGTLINPKYDFELGKPLRVPVYGRKVLKDSPVLLPAVSVESDDFITLESSVEENPFDSFKLDIENIDYNLLEFINCIEDNNVDLVRIILNIPQFNKNFIVNN